MANARPTLADVARASGMSTTSVSLVLNNKSGARISEAAARRIRLAAEELGYRANPAARSLRTGSTQSVGFMSNEVTISRYASEMIRGVLDIAHTRDHAVLITEFGDDPTRRDEAARTLLNQRPDGLILAEMGAKEIDLPTLRTGVPLVLANAAAADSDITSVLPGEFEAGRAVVRHLLDAGHRRIALIGANDTFRDDPRISVTIGRRFDGIEAEFTAAGFDPVREVYTPDWEPEYGYRAMDDLSLSGVEFTAVIALNDRLAFGAYQAAHARGFRIPEDVSMVSFDDEILASYVHPALTSCRIPYREIGARALELLLDGRTHDGVVLLPMPLQVRGSVRRRG